MRRIIILASLAAMLSGGAAMASPRSEDHREAPRVEQRVESRRAPASREPRYVDRDRRPEPKLERHEERADYRWVGGEWSWNGHEWIWIAGHYVRVYIR